MSAGVPQQRDLRGSDMFEGKRIPSDWRLASLPELRVSRGWEPALEAQARRISACEGFDVVRPMNFPQGNQLLTALLRSGPRLQPARPMLRERAR